MTDLNRARAYHLLFWAEGGALSGAFIVAIGLTDNSSLLAAGMFLAAWVVLSGIVILGLIPTWQEMGKYIYRDGMVFEKGPWFEGDE